MFWAICFYKTQKQSYKWWAFRKTKQDYKANINRFLW